MDNILNILLNDYLEGTLSPEREQQLFAMLASGDYDEALSDRLQQDFRSGIYMLPEFKSIRERNFERIAAKTGIGLTIMKPASRRVHFLKTTWFRYAAIVLLLLGTGAYFFYYNVWRQAATAITQATTQPIPDIAPGGNKAILTLSDGSTIVLDSAANGSLAQQGAAKVIKLSNGQLAYNLEGSPQDDANNKLASPGEPSRLNKAPGYNTISTPKGGQYQIVLPDGTRVWLNAASAIRFPTAFASERRVTITGEAYLEITPDAKRPFTVMTSGNREIRVLGTSFNVNAYEEEPVMKTTLLEGSINVFLNNQSHVLKPGQQALINNTVNALNIIDKADLQQVIAWKNGAFNFEGARLPEVMRQIERWYDVTVVYEKGTPDIEFVGKMGRSMPLSGMITAFERMGIHCRVEPGRKLIVTL